MFKYFKQFAIQVIAVQLKHCKQLERTKLLESDVPTAPASIWTVGIKTYNYSFMSECINSIRTVIESFYDIASFAISRRTAASI